MIVSDNQNSTGDIIVKVFRIIKANILLIILIIACSIGAGAIYSYYSKPTYTAMESVSYKATVTDESTKKYQSFSSITAMEAYYQSVIEFCSTGNILDRADFYYKEYLLTNYAFNDDLDGFIKEVNNGQHEYIYQEGDINNYFSRGNVSISMIDEETFVLKIGFTDLNAKEAKEKLRLFILACNFEMEQAFAGVKTQFNELAQNSASIEVKTNSSTFKVLVIAGILGIVLVGAVVYAKTILDNKIREKDELEKLVGAQLFAYIDDQGAEDGRK